MKKMILFLQIALLSASVAFSQSYYEKKATTDTLFRLGGKVVPCKILHVKSLAVDYTVDGDPKVYSIERKQIQKIVYKSGKVEEFNKPVFIAIDETSWEAVLITENKEDVQGLYNRGKVSAKSSPGSRNKKAALNSVQIRMQKKAANIGGAIVLITHKESRGGYGEIPGYYMIGDVYGFEPLEEGEEGTEDFDR